ncbi:hypothetical protein HK16_14065 [Acetobacter senegalensis]|uniref:Type I restriction modification DNA specificity domain-containing protein n=2 Tax=Acetobacter TaxID=434 RepID=A0A252EHD9_9PROT|nr:MULTISPECIES: restriction endonuclease subunit S [Acetobacter]ATJ89620.1 restriction endonuclease subunit S [Acetobacter tropicalis]OUL65827.1 hypothetical protein HK16_14065 [Acetobacter senegalensis]
MSAASFLEKLLDGVEVVWVPLGDVTQPTANVKWSKAEGVYRYIDLTSVDVKSKRVTEISEISAETAPSRAQKLVEENDVIFATTRPAQQRYCLIDSKLSGNVASTGYCVLRAKQDQVLPKWILHWLSTTEFKNYVEENQSGAAYPAISDGKVKTFKIAIPCPDDPEKSLAIQGEIVRILDSFTELTTELTAELTQRKKQYNHYREQLLSFDEDEVEWKTLGDVALKSYSGATPKAGNPKYYTQGTIPWLRTQEVVFSDIHETNVKITQAAVDETAAKWVPENCVIIAISGATAGRSAINKIPLTTNQHCCCLAIDPSQANYRYVFHWVSRNYETLREMGQGARGDLNSGLIKGFKIPIPFADDSQKSLAEQARIVSILDTFDTLTTSITEGLPREIELREKQYAYYRDQLLSFRKPDIESA